MRKTIVFCLPFLIGLLLLSGCKSSKTPIGTYEANTKELNEFVTSMQQQELKFHTFSARLGVDLNIPGKEMSSRVEMKLVKDSVLQLSVQPMLGIEVFRIELSRDSVKALDRLNKQYVAEGYDALKEQFPFDFNFYNLQALFINRLFVPGYQEVDSYLYNHFYLDRQGLTTWLKTQDRQKLNYVFKASNEEKLLSTQIIEPTGVYELAWDYSDFQQVLSPYIFPCNMKISLLKEETSQGDIAIAFSRIQLNRALNMSFSIPAKYKRITFAQILKAITHK